MLFSSTRGMQVRITMGYHFTCYMAIFLILEGIGRKESLIIISKNENLYSRYGKNMNVSHKLKVKLLYTLPSKNDIMI